MTRLSTERSDQRDHRSPEIHNPSGIGNVSLSVNQTYK